MNNPKPWNPKDHCGVGKGPLAGLQVLDLSRVLAGPSCTMMLADMGARVIKVEQPGSGDDTRAFGPPFLEGESTYFMSVNRNKQSLTLNLKDPRGKEIGYQLVRRSHVLVENYRPGTAAKLGFGYEQVHAMNPALVYASVSGFGQTGPESLRPGYDLVVQGMSGIQGLTGDPQGPPFKVGTSIADLVAGLYATQGILFALLALQCTGEGQWVDVSLLDGQVSLLTYQAGIQFAQGSPPQRMGNRHPSISPYETYPAADGYFNLAVGNQRLWEHFCKIMELPELAADPRFASNPDRVKNRVALYEALAPRFLEKPVAHWVALFDREVIPAGPILTLNQVFAHPQVLAREMLVKMEHPTAGVISQIGNPVKLSATPAELKSPPPLLGQHTETVLAELGLGKEEIEALRRDKVV